VLERGDAAGDPSHGSHAPATRRWASSRTRAH